MESECLTVILDAGSRLETATAAAEQATDNVNGDAKACGKAVTINLSTVVPERVKWLWSRCIPLGKISLLDGDPSLGKSSISLDLAARVSTGRSMPDGSPGVDGGAVILTAEDGLSDTVAPRLGGMGARLERIVALQAAIDEDGKHTFPTLQSLEAIAEAAHTVDAKFIVIDPLMAYLPSGTNSYRDQDIRQSLAPLSTLAEELGAAILIIRHLNKTASPNAVYRGGGSIGIIGAVRSGLLVARDPDNDERRVLASIKCNLCLQPPSLEYHIVSADHGASCIIWDGHSTHSASDLLASSTEGSEEQSAMGEAEKFLTEVLKGGSVSAKEVMKQSRECGFSDATLRRAKKKQGVLVSKKGMKEGWVWSLPPKGAHEHSEDAEGAHEKKASTFDAFEQKASTFVGEEVIDLDS